MATKVWSFHGGVHPVENKSQSNHKPIQKAEITGELVLPMNQHIGAPATPCVNVGDLVVGGQIIATAKGNFSANMHAPTSGQITAIESRLAPHASGLSTPVIVIKPDGQDLKQSLEPITDIQNTSPDVLIKRIYESGIIGMGGAGFPTSVKAGADASAIETIVVNAVECEPYITADDVLMREHSDEILDGIGIYDKIFSPKQILIGIEDNKPEAIAAMRQSSEKSKLPIKVVVVPTKYPSGGEKQLIQLLTGREVPSGKIPASLGIVVQNVHTFFSIGKAVFKGEPLTERVVTVTGKAVKEPANYWVKLGCNVKDLVEGVGLSTEPSHYIMGGPMMGFELPSADVPVVKTTNCIICPEPGELKSKDDEKACIRCGECAKACPALLLPQQLYWHAKAKEFDKAESYHLKDCIECGACAYVCPSDIPLVQYFRFAKTEVREQTAHRQKSERAKVRFDARQDRLEQAKREKEERARKRKEAAAKKAQETGNKDADKQAVIKAALERANAKKAAKADETKAQDKAPTKDTEE